MNRTPFALFTLLCTLASSIVAAGNASRRAGVDHAPAPVPVAKSSCPVRQVSYVASADVVEPAWNASAWKSIDVRGAYLSLIDRLPKSVRELAPGNAPDAAKLKAVNVAKQATAASRPAEFTKAPTANRVTRNVQAEPKKPAKNEAPQVAKSRVSANSPLRQAATSHDQGWNWQSVVLIAGKYSALREAWFQSHAPQPAMIRIGSSIARPGVEFKEAGAYSMQGHWTPALHVSDNGDQLLSAIYTPAAGGATLETPATARPGAIAAAARQVERLLQQAVAARHAATEQYLESFLARWLPQPATRPSAVSAQLPGQTQK